MKRRLLSILLAGVIAVGSGSMAFAADNGDLPENDTDSKTHCAIEGIGDLNRDGKISALDALSLLRYTVGLDEYLPFAIPSKETGIEDPEFYADVNGDGEVTTTDALAILRITVGLDKDPGEQIVDFLDATEFSSAITGEYYYCSPEPEHYQSDIIALLTTASDGNMQQAPEGYDDAFFKEHDLICFRTFTDGTTVPAVGQVAYTDGYVYLRYWDEAAEVDAGTICVAVTIPKGFADGKKLTAVRAEALVPQQPAFYYMYDEYRGKINNRTVFWADSRESLHTMVRELEQADTMVPDFGEWLNVRNTEAYFDQYVLVMQAESGGTCNDMKDHVFSRVEIEGDTAIVYLQYIGWDHMDGDEAIPDVFGATWAYAIDVPKADLEGCTNIVVRTE